MRNRPTKRRGFSLPELLVAIAILAILMALTTAAVMRFRNVGPQSATKTNLGKVLIALRTKSKAVSDKARGELMEPPFASLATGSNLEARRRSYIDLKVAQALPMSFAEVFAATGWPAYQNYLASFGITSANHSSVPLEVQRAVCVVMILEKGPGGGGITAEDLGASAVGRLELTGIGGRAPGAVDGWNRPVLFTRSYQGQGGAIALVSAGADGQFGVDSTTLSNTNDAQARDNLLVTNP